MTEPSTKKLCELCKERPAALNGYVCEDCLRTAEFQDNIQLILIGANGTDEYGVVVLSPLGMPNSEHNELAGHWHYYPEGTSGYGNTHITLLKPIDALMDRATLVLAEITQRRLEGLPLMGPIAQTRKRRTSDGTKTRQPRKQKVAEEEVNPQAETIKGLQALRDKIRAKAQ